MAGGWEWLVILAVVILLFGARKLPELAGSIGKSITAFRKETEAAKAEADDDTEPSSSSTDTA